MIIGYNPKVYIRGFVNRLKKEIEPNQIQCIDEKKDIFKILEGINWLYLELDDIINIHKNTYQLLKLKWEGEGLWVVDFIKINDELECLQENDKEIIFYVKNDILVDEE